MGWFEDACAWVDQAVEDVGAAIDDAGEAIEQAVSDVVDWATDAAGDVVEAVGATITGALETAVDFGEAVGDTLSGRDPVETWSEFGMNALDNMVFDPVDYLTDGDVNLDYEDGTFTADVDLDLGIGAVGLHVGEAGFDASASFDLFVASGSISLDSSAGFAATGSLGIADGPLPYAEGHLTIGTDGVISIGGEVQGSLPLPDGYLGGSMGGELVMNMDGSWDVSGHVSGEFDGPGDSGAYFDAEGQAGMDADGGFDVSGSFDAGVSDTAGAHVDVHTAFEAGLDDGRLEGMVEGDVSGGGGDTGFDLGGRVAAGVGAGGPSADLDGWADLDVPDASAAPNAATGGLPVTSSGAALDGGDSATAFDDPFAAGNDDFGAPPPADLEIPQVEAPPEPEPQADEFSQQIQAVDEMADKADDMWDDIGQ